MFVQARELGCLNEADLSLFDAFETENFELVLAALNTTIRTLEALELDSEPLFERYVSVQGALGEAVRYVHLDLVDVPEDVSTTLKQVLLDHRWVFTTSYDLLIYWGMGYEDNFKGLFDGILEWRTCAS